MKISANAPCPCHSGKKYKKCCQPYHKGASASNALLLMRSRYYSAFVLHLKRYIIATTHPDNSDYTKDTKEWEGGIEQFCDNTNFTGLEIMEFMNGENEAFVKFKANLGDVCFVEKSRFLKNNGKWLYESGEFE